MFIAICYGLHMAINDVAGKLVHNVTFSKKYSLFSPGSSFIPVNRHRCYPSLIVHSVSVLLPIVFAMKLHIMRNLQG